MGIQLILSVIGLILTSIALFISNTVDGTNGISSGKKTLPSANLSEQQIKSSNDTRPTDLPPAQSSSHQVVRTISEAAKREAVTNVASHNTIQVDNATNSRPRWVDVEHIVKDVINSIMKHLLPTMLRITSKVHISSPCLSRLLKMVVSVRQLESWAIKMVDASGKPFSGLLEGTLTDFGSYEECLNIIVESENPNSEPLRGKYCILEITPNLPQETRQLDPRLHNTQRCKGVSSLVLDSPDRSPLDGKNKEGDETRWPASSGSCSLQTAVSPAHTLAPPISCPTSPYSVLLSSSSGLSSYYSGSTMDNKHSLVTQIF
ncbi:uncharacterized protein LOC143245946 [Tachypleus tridentatus]|uniref:uncharacterized protein LOC143245946 n=1 Tax=Tachypleus tridentatus TaxID=6853 RepID=UPI003FD0DA32